MEPEIKQDEWCIISVGTNDIWWWRVARYKRRKAVSRRKRRRMRREYRA